MIQLLGARGKNCGDSCHPRWSSLRFVRFSGDNDRPGPSVRPNNPHDLGDSIIENAVSAPLGTENVRRCQILK